jgi:hypothetical protein
MKPGHLLVSVLLVTLIAVFSCGKSNSKSKPKLTLQSITTTVDTLPPHDSLVALFKFSSGDHLPGGTFYAIRVRLNQTPLPANDSVGLDTFPNTIPDFPGSSGQIRFSLNHDFLSQSTPINQNDTIIYKFFAITPDSVSTDTLKSPHIVVINS